MNFGKYQQAFLIGALLLGVSTNTLAQQNVEVNVTVGVLLTPTATTSQCDRDITSELRFVVNDTVVNEDMVLEASPSNLFNIGDQLNVELVEDLRVCTRHDYVDLWIALEMPDDTRLFMVSTVLPPFISFVPQAAPFKTDLDRGENRHSVLNFEVTPYIPTGDYRFYAAYAESGKDLSELLFTLRSNRAMAKVVLSGR